LSAALSDATAILNTPPGPARPGPSCTWCAVRARCNPGWQRGQQVAEGSKGTSGSVDVELKIASSPTATGYRACRTDGVELSVVFDAPIGVGLPEVQVGESIRLVDAFLRTSGRELEIKPWTELYRLP
jgi:hypothetical protein